MSEQSETDRRIANEDINQQAQFSSAVSPNNIGTGRTSTNNTNDQDENVESKIRIRKTKFVRPSSKLGLQQYNVMTIVLTQL